MSRLRKAIVGVLLLVAAGLLVATVLVGHRSPSDTERVNTLAGELRCPTCESQTVADSDTPVAAGMRAEVARQVAAGRSDAQILGWFRSRYGAGVVLVPSSQGVGPVLWAVPAIALVAGAGLAGWRWRRRTRVHSPAEPVEPAARAQGSGALPPARLALVLGLVVASGLATSLAFTGQHDGGTASASSPTSRSRDAATTSPSRTTDPVSTAFGLLQQGHPLAAESLVRPLAGQPGRTGTLALLVLGLAQRAADDPAAPATLRRFLREHPHHAAAAQVRRLLAPRTAG